MTRLKYIGSMPSAVLFDGREVKKGEPFEVNDEKIAEDLLRQTDNYAPADAPRAKSKGASA